MNPLDEYTQRLERRRATVSALSRRDDLIANLRFVVFVVGVVNVFAAWSERIGWAWLGIPVFAFAALAIVHERVLRAKKRALAGVSHYEHAVARIDGTWPGKGISGESFAPQNHEYAADLDLFGKGSFFELLCAARTRAGQATLASWLLAPATMEEIQQRQEAIAELRERLDLREDLAISGDLVRKGVETEVLIRWASAPQVFNTRWPRAIALVVTAFSLTSITILLPIGLGNASIAGALALASVGYMLTKSLVEQVMRSIEEPRRELAVLALALERLERESFQSAKLVRLRSAIVSDSGAASRHVARLQRLATMHEARNNQLFTPLALILMWDLHFAYAFESWRARHGKSVEQWLRAVGELEALCSLAAYAYERHGDVFPEIVASTGNGIFEGAELGHPLLKPTACVRNDVRLNSETRLFIVSGSNMSGKSTLLRTIGINAVLALVGAPVYARSLRMTPLAVGATLRIQDSIHDGSSRFYAEISRLRQLMDLSKSKLPLLFLLDELLAGTNSRDRRVGAEGILGSLMDTGAVGLVTTHDLALADIASELAPRAVNVHFEDHLEDGKLTFDYRLHAGVVERSNALELMRAVGLVV